MLSVFSVGEAQKVPSGIGQAEITLGALSFEGQKLRLLDCHHNNQLGVQRNTETGTAVMCRMQNMPSQEGGWQDRGQRSGFILKGP